MRDEFIMVKCGECFDTHDWSVGEKTICHTECDGVGDVVEDVFVRIALHAMEVQLDCSRERPLESSRRSTGS